MLNCWYKIKYLLLVATFTLATSCGQQPNLPVIPGVQGPFFNLLDGKVLITLKLLKANLPHGAKLPIPKTRDSSFEVTPNLQDGGTMVVFHLSIEDLKTIKIGTGDANTLPDGRPIPGIEGGSLKSSLRVDTEMLDLSFYFHEKLFGFYIPLGWETHGFGGSWNIVIKEQNIGMLGAVASDSDGRGAGLILFLRLENLRNKKLQQLIDLSEKKPRTIY